MQVCELFRKFGKDGIDMVFSHFHCTANQFSFKFDHEKIDANVDYPYFKAIQTCAYSYLSNKRRVAICK